MSTLNHTTPPASGCKPPKISPTMDRREMLFSIITENQHRKTIPKHLILYFYQFSNFFSCARFQCGALQRNNLLINCIDIQGMRQCDRSEHLAGLKAQFREKKNKEWKNKMGHNSHSGRASMHFNKWLF